MEFNITDGPLELMIVVLELMSSVAAEGGLSRREEFPMFVGEEEGEAPKESKMLADV